MSGPNANLLDDGKSTFGTGTNNDSRRSQDATNFYGLAVPSPCRGTVPAETPVREFRRPDTACFDGGDNNPSSGSPRRSLRLRRGTPTKNNSSSLPVADGCNNNAASPFGGKNNPNGPLHQYQNQRRPSSRNAAGVRFQGEGASAPNPIRKRERNDRNVGHQTPGGVKRSRVLPPKIKFQQSRKVLDAPSNTTQFLITDREERESSVPAGHQLDSSSAQRPRCFSAVEQLHSFSSSSDDEEQDPEFNQVLDDVNMERIEGLSREMVNKELLSAERVNRQLEDKIVNLMEENQMLKTMLMENGIEFPEVQVNGIHKFNNVRTKGGQNNSF